MEAMAHRNSWFTQLKISGFPYKSQFSHGFPMVFHGFPMVFPLKMRVFHGKIFNSRQKIAPRGLNPRQLAIRKKPHRGQAPKRWGPMDAHGAHGVVQMAAEDPGPRQGMIQKWPWRRIWWC